MKETLSKGSVITLTPGVDMPEGVRLLRPGMTLHFDLAPWHVRLWHWFLRKIGRPAKMHRAKIAAIDYETRTVTIE